MNRTLKVSDLAEFDAAVYLASDADVAAYLTSVLEDDDPSLLAAALGDIARARGMSNIAREADMAREALYKALRRGSEPRFETIRRVCMALGLRLVIEPAKGAT
jgi:probable addiction module antidote protein